MRAWPTTQRRPEVRRIRGGGRRARTVFGMMLAGVLAVTGCANLPDSSAPQALGTIDREPLAEGPPPTLGRGPEQLLREFLQATANPANHHATARQYLTPEAAAKWDDTARTVIVDQQPDVLRESHRGGSQTFQVRARKIGELETGGTYRVRDNTLEDHVEMVQVGGEWRISDMSPGVVMESTAFDKFYRRYALNFPDAAGTSMVPDLRWISARKEDLAQQLLSLLAAGPQESLAPAVRNVLSGPISVRGDITTADGNRGVGLGGGVRIDFAGASALDQHTKELLAAQVVLTLSSADILGPYKLFGDGKPLDERHADTGWSIGDVNALNPAVHSRNAVGLHAVRDGELVRVTDRETEQAPGYFGAARNLRSVGLTPDGQLVAAVADSGRPPPESQILLIGSYDGDDRNVLAVAEGNNFTRPSWTADGGSAWSVVDGSRVIRAGHDRNTGNVSVQDVDTSALFATPTSAEEPVVRGPITELRMSSTGTRAAIIADGKAYVAVVVPQPDGRYALTSPSPLSSNVGSTAVSLDWVSDDTIMLAREGNVEPVNTVVVDGSQTEPVSSQNLTPNVRMVSASSDVQYVADARAVMALGPGDPDRSWREVYSLGSNTVPVLPG